jgi:hypothetical protein
MGCGGKEGGAELLLKVHFTADFGTAIKSNLVKSQSRTGRQSPVTNSDSNNFMISADVGTGRNGASRRPLWQVPQIYQ